jgi:DNA-binding transcriptional LysR family regulator
MLSLKQLKYLVEIVDAGGYTRAAEKLFIAQSALSRQVKEMEDELDVQLLQRDAKRLELTPAGQLMYERGKKMLDELADTVVQARSLQRGEQGTVRLLHSSSVPLAGRLPSILAQLLQESPGISLDVSQASSEHQAHEIEEGRADIGLVRLPVLRKLPDVLYTDCYAEKLLAALPAKHHLAQQASLPLKALGQEQFVSAPHKERGGLSYLVAELCIQQGFYPQPARAQSRKASLLGLVAAGFGVAVVPASMQEIAPEGIVFVPLQGECLSKVGLLSHRDASPLVQSFAAQLLQRIAAD